MSYSTPNDTTASPYVGSNGDAYSNQGCIWQIAKRHNIESMQRNGAYACVRRHKSSKKTHRGILG